MMVICKCATRGASKRMLKNKLFCDELASGKITMKKYLCGRRFECNRTTRMMKTTTIAFDKQLLMIQEMRMGKRTGTKWDQDNKSFKIQPCTRCPQQPQDDLMHQILGCPHMEEAAQMGLMVFNNQCEMHSTCMNNKQKMYDQMKQDIRALRHNLINTEWIVDTAMQDIVNSESVETKEQYNRAINNMSTFINIEHIVMLRNHNNDTWPQEAQKMKSRIPGKLHWILGDGFYEVYKINMHLIENRKIMAMYNEKPRKMLQNMRNIIKDESMLWKYLLCPGGSVVQQNMVTLVLACILQSKERCEAIASFDIIQS